MYMVYASNDLGALNPQNDGNLESIQSTPGVYTFASGTGFYQQCMPTESVCLGFSCAGMHME